MGCDIHTRIEYKDRDGKWVCGDFFRLYPRFDPHAPEGREPYHVVGLCDDRDYELFATLADVRNYDEVPCIDEPRGIPEDVCENTKKDYKAWGEDAHSASHFTLRELIDWNNSASSMIKRSGFVTLEAAENLDKGIEPEMWCRWTNNPEYVWREWETECKPLDRLIEDMKRRGYDLWLWFSEKSLEERADTMRIVFWFDN